MQTDQGKVHKRAVARRACLSCREKKIRCDGERLRSAASGSLTCTNCQVFGIDCVFVQSMRGGFRRKRAPSNGSDHSAAAGDARPPKTASRSPHASPHSGPRGPAAFDQSQKLSHANLVSHNDSLGVATPPLPQLQSQHAPMAHMHTPAAPGPPMAPNPHLPHSTPHGTPHMPHPSLPGAGPAGPAPYDDDKDDARHRYYYPGYVPRPGYAQYAGSSGYFSYESAPVMPPPPPIPEMAPYGYGVPSAAREFADGAYARHAAPRVEETLPSNFHHVDGSRLPAPRLASAAMSPDPEGRDGDPFSRTSSNSQASQSQLPVADYKSYRKASRGGSYFKLAELEACDLPSDDVLTDVIDYFYDFHYVNCTFLPLKSYLLKWFSTSCETSVYHAIIACVCSKRLWPFQREEYYWLEKMYKYWDNLNDFGMFICYTLVCRIPYVAGNPDIFFDIKKRTQEIIINNKYVETMGQRHSSSKRKLYENEAVIRMLWLSWIESSFLSMRGSQPYSNDPTYNTLDFTSFDFMTISSKLPLPLSSESFNNLDDSNRLTWEEFRANKHNDVSSVIKAAHTLSTVLSRIAANELFEDTYHTDTVFEEIIDARRYEIINSKLHLSSSVSLSQQIYRYSRLLQGLHFTKKIFIFEFLAGQDSSQAKEPGEAEIHWVNSMTCSKMMDVGELFANVKETTQFQWKCLFDLITNTAKLLELFELFLGIIPGDTVSKYPVISGPEIYTTKVVDVINEGQTTTGEESWLKMSDFAIFCGSLLVVVVPSLVVLRAFIAVEKGGGKSRIVNRKDPAASRVLDFDVPDAVIEKFQPPVLNRWFERIGQYIRFRLQYEGNKKVQFETQANINKLGHYMEEIIRNI